MAKFYGSIGYSTTEETSPGVWSQRITEKEYYGDILKNVRRNEKTQYTNDDLNISNIFSIISDDFAYSNINNIKYIKWRDVKWKVVSAEILHPRLNLTVGGVYNEH